jgi:dienelactone hydrolase
MRTMKAALAALMLVTATAATAQNGPPPITPATAPAEPDAIPLYGDKNPGARATEVWGRYGGKQYGVRNVTYPTLTPVLPDPAKATGAAVVVAPGGAFMGLAIEHEGWQVARALADRGIAAFVLKYRLIPTPRDEGEAGKFMGMMIGKEIAGAGPMAGELLAKSPAPADARAALAMVRSGAARWKIDPARTGMIGFSAGAMTARRVALDAPPAERPAFVGYIYGPQDAEAVPADAPPLFNAIALDDGLFPSQGFPIATAWLAAKRPVEVHGYQRGNHGFGLGIPGTTSTGMIDQYVAWLAMQGFLKKAAQ